MTSVLKRSRKGTDIQDQGFVDRDEHPSRVETSWGQRFMTPCPMVVACGTTLPGILDHPVKPEATGVQDFRLPCCRFLVGPVINIAMVN